MKKISFWLSFVVFVVSCSSPAKKETETNSVPVTAVPKDSTLSRSVLIPKINCKADPAVNYALYLPSSYSVNKPFPVVFFFDSHGSGTFPLEKYKQLAEKYGYIFAGSNNSKNGMSWDQNHPQIKIFIEDVKQRLNIDDKRIYACGFSGGSRVASSVAIFDGGITGVIGMGAGFPSLNESIRNRFDYIAFAGNEDFNMGELLSLNASMDQSPIRHQLIIFNGKHEWAPEEIAEDAFIWCELNAMKDGLVPANDSLIKNFIVKNEEVLMELKHNKKYYSEYLLYKKVINCLDGLADVSQWKEKLEISAKSDELKKELALKEKVAKEEMEKQKTYRENFALKNLAWWTKEITVLKAQSKNKNDPERAVMKKRLLSYLSLVAYMDASSALASDQLELTEVFLHIYEMVDPENCEHQYLFADVYSRKKDNAKALIYLENSVKLGFNDITRLEADSSFSFLKSNPGFQKLLAQLQVKQ